MISINVLIGVLLALLGAVLINVGKGIEKLKVHVFSQGWGMFRPPHRRDLGIWCTGLVMTASYGVLQWTAMNFVNNPSLIVSMTGFGLVALVLFAIKIIGEHVTKKEIIGIGIIVVCTVMMPYFQKTQPLAIAAPPEIVNVDQQYLSQFIKKVPGNILKAGNFRGIKSAEIEAAALKLNLPKTGLDENQLAALGENLGAVKVIAMKITGGDKSVAVELRVVDVAGKNIEKTVQNICENISSEDLKKTIYASVNQLFPNKYNMTYMIIGSVLLYGIFGLLCAFSVATKKIHGFSFGAMAGSCNAVAAILSKVTWVHVGVGASIFAQLKYPFLYIALISGIGATVFTQIGYVRDRAIIVVPTFMSLNIVAPSLLEYFVFGTYLAPIQYLFMIGIIAGVIFLSVSTPEKVLAVEVEEGAAGAVD